MERMTEDEIELLAEQISAKLIANMAVRLKRDTRAYGNASQHLGDIVYKHRNRKKMSQIAMAQLAGMDATVISKVEHGQRGLTLADYFRISAALDQPFFDRALSDYFMGQD